MSRQYIGARYVPVFADPLAWDITKNYDALTIVQNNNDTYTSKKAVPSGTAITNTEYWVKTGNYNAQLQEYIEIAGEAAEKADEAIEIATEIDDNTIAFYFKPATFEPVDIPEVNTSNPITIISLPKPITVDDNTVLKVSVFTRGTSMYWPQSTPSNRTHVGTIRFATASDTISGLNLGEVETSVFHGVEDVLMVNNGEFIVTKNGTQWICSGSTAGSVVDEGERKAGALAYASKYSGADSGAMTFNYVGLRYDRSDRNYDSSKTGGIYVVIEKRTLMNN